MNVADVGYGDLERVEQQGTAALGDVAAGDGASHVAERHLDGGGVLEERELEGFEDLGAEVVFGEVALAAVVLEVAGLAEVGLALEVAMMEVAEAGALEGGRLAELSAGLDVVAGGIFGHCLSLGGDTPSPPFCKIARINELGSRVAKVVQGNGLRSKS